MYVVQYVLLELPQSILFKLNLDCVKCQLTQNKKEISLFECSHSIPSLSTLHLSDYNSNITKEIN